MKYKQNRPERHMCADTTLEELSELLKDVDLIYVYPHHRIELTDGELCQTRSGPNWEGGILTVATCKHLLRTYKSLEPKKVALCGITNKIQGENYLLYVGVIDEMFDSNYSLGAYLKTYYPEAYKVKSAIHNRLGDILEPCSLLFSEEDKYDSFNFEEPCEDHCRFEEKESNGQSKYIKDIEYESHNKQRPKCLTLNPVVIHTAPDYVFTGKLGRSGMALKGKDAAEQLIFMLEETL